MNKRIKRLAIASAVSAAVGVAGIPALEADSMMWPYTVVSTTVTTILSVVNHGSTQATSPTGVPSDLHYSHFHKDPADLSNTGKCLEVDVRRPTTPEDIVTFDLGGKFGAATNGVLFNDPTNYQNRDFALLAGAAPTRGFSLVDNLLVDDAELYGEARIYEITSGAMWGYRAYNGTNDSFTAPLFTNGQEVQGEVLANNPAGTFPELTPVELLPLNEWVTAFFVTPVGSAPPSPPPGPAISVTGQRTGTWSAAFQLHDIEPSTGLDLVAFDRDENPVSGHIPNPVTCVGRIDLPELIVAGSQPEMPDGGWAYADVLPVILDPDDIMRQITRAAVVFKLEYNTGNTFNGEPITGVVNTAVWLRDMGSLTSFGSRQFTNGIDGF